MARDTYSSLKSKIEKEIAKLQRQAQTLQLKQRTPVISSIIRSMREYDITPEEITNTFNKKSIKSAAPKSPLAARPKNRVPAKFRHPETGETWTGRGKTPRWISAAEAQGQSRNDFLIIR
ncbi:MAG: H-NS histone family protein [Burkholderiaceae bacterium]